MRKRSSSIGGQAVIEGVMMRGERSIATAVRDEKGNIVVESKYVKPTKDKNFLFRTPFLRGIFNFVSTMFVGVGTLLRSGEVFDGETQPSKAEQWFAKTFKLDVFSVVMAFAVVLGVALSLVLFYFLPQLIVTGVEELFRIDTSANIGVQIGMNLLEGAIRMLIFVGYIALTALMKDVRRTYMYHGAEHKTISCYEHGLELTVENAQKMTTIHDRCGTTFMFITMVISVLVFSLTGWSEQLWLRLVLRLALIPVVAGISYEILKFLAKFDNKFVRMLKAPGLALQKLTTRQPQDDMVEVAIAAFKTVQAMDADPNLPELRFDTKLLFHKVEKEMIELCGGDTARAHAIMSAVLAVNEEELTKVSHIKSSKLELMKAIARGEADPDAERAKAEEEKRAEARQSGEKTDASDDDGGANVGTDAQTNTEDTDKSDGSESGE